MSAAPRTSAVVLAAGAGSRFGGDKLMATVGGRPILQHVLGHLASAGLGDVVVVLGADAERIEAAIEWRTERRILNPDPARGLSSSLREGIDALDPTVERALIVLGDQPMVPTAVIESLLASPLDAARPVVVPVYADDRGRNPVLLERRAFDIVTETSGDRGLGPWIATHPERIRELAVEGANPDVDTRDDLVGLLEAAWADRVRANKEQVDRFREVPDATDFYAPVSAVFRADPTRTDEPALTKLLGLLEPGDTWLDIGAGAGRYALPIARAVAGSGGRVIALDPSAGMLEALGEVAREYGIANYETIHARWPPEDGDVSRYRADVAMIAHVSYDVAMIGPFVGAMEAAARRRCVAMLMERQPSSIADVFWPVVWGEARISLPALPEFVELLRARGRQPEVTWTERDPRRFDSHDDLAAFLRRQLWVAEGTAADRRFLDALEPLVVVDADGRALLRGQRPQAIGIVTWVPRDPS